MARGRSGAALLGGAAALLLHTWLLTGGDWAVFAERRGAAYFDAQAEAWLDGHWWIPEAVAGIEGIVVDGRTQIYFGPFPALLRLPLALLGDSAGRLSVLSMLLAAAVASFAGVRLLRQAEQRWPHGAGDRAGLVLTALVAFVVPAGTVLAFLASRTIVYHEAGAWGAATGLLALSLVVDAVDEPSRRNTVLAVLVATLCALSRVSIALGPVVALGLLALLRLRATRRPGAVLLAPVVPVVALAAVNLIRFGSPFSVPFQQQVQTSIDPTREGFFAANGGFFSLDFVPTTLFHYLQPFGLRPSGWFPFVEFPPAGRVLGGARFDLVDRTASVPATMPALVLLTLVAAVLLLRRGSSGLRVAAVGAVAAAGPVFLFGYVAHRYLADFLPLVVVGGVLGLVALLGVPAARWRTAALAGAGLLAAFGVWTNVGLGLLQQRLWGAQIDQPVVGDFVADRIAIDDRLGLARAVVHRAEDLHERVGTGDFVVIGDCEALYLETGTPVGFLPMGHWRTVERSSARVTVRVALDGEDVRRRDSTVLAEIHDGEQTALLRVERVDRSRVRLRWNGRPEATSGPPFELGARDQRVLEVTADPFVDELVVRDGKQVLLSGLYLGDGRPRLQAGDPVPGPPPDICRRLLASVDEARGVG